MRLAIGLGPPEHAADQGIEHADRRIGQRRLSIAQEGRQGGVSAAWTHLA